MLSRLCGCENFPDMEGTDGLSTLQSFGSIEGEKEKM